MAHHTRGGLLLGLLLMLSGIPAAVAQQVLECLPRNGAVLTDPLIDGFGNRRTLPKLPATLPQFNSFAEARAYLVNLFGTQDLQALSQQLGYFVDSNLSQNFFINVYSYLRSGCESISGPSVVTRKDLRLSLRLMSRIWQIRNAQRGGRGNRAQGMASPGAFQAAGDGENPLPINTWVSYNYGDFSSDYAVQGRSLGYDADSHNVLAGGDVMLGERVALGLSFGYQSLDAKTRFNSGTAENDGVTIAPYLAVLLSDMVSLDFSGGYTALDYETQRLAGSGATLRGEFDADRWFIAGNANASITRDRWITGLRVGFSHAEETQNARIERELDLTQFSAATDVTYAIGNFEPYVMVAYYRDLVSENGELPIEIPANASSLQSDDDDEIQLSAGLRWFIGSRVVGGLEYTRVESREDFEADLVMATVRLAL